MRNGVCDNEMKISTDKENCREVCSVVPVWKEIVAATANETQMVLLIDKEKAQPE